MTKIPHIDIPQAFEQLQSIKKKVHQVIAASLLQTEQQKMSSNNCK